MAILNGKRTRRLGGLMLSYVAAVVLQPYGGRTAIPEEPKPKADGALAVIAHPENPLDDVTVKQLRAILLAEQQFWKHGGRIVVIRRHSKGPSANRLAKRVFRMNQRALRKYWVRKLYAGDIPALPPVVRKDKAAVDAVGRQPRAISVVPASAVTDAVRVLRIDGKAPGDRGYLLAAPKAAQ